MEDVQESAGIEDMLEACQSDLTGKEEDSKALQESLLQSKVQEMQRQLEMQYQQKLEEHKRLMLESLQSRPTPDVVDLENDASLKVGLTEALGTHLTKNPVAPFGVQRHKSTNVSSPYTKHQGAKMGDGMDPKNGKKEQPPIGGGAG